MLSPEQCQWYVGIPPAVVVSAHESYHARNDGIRLDCICVGPGMQAVRSDPCRYGEWLQWHRTSPFGPYVSITRLKATEGQVLASIGFTQWDYLNQFANVPGSWFYPVGLSGLPLGFEVATPAKARTGPVRRFRRVKS